MFRHLVVVRWAREVTGAELAELAVAVDELVRQCEQVRSFTHGPDAGARPGSADYGLVVDFDDAEGWAVYDVHPAHVRLRESIGPLAAELRVAQFTTPG